MIIEDENLENVNGGEGVVYSTDCCGDYLPKQSGEDVLEKNCYSCYYFETRRMSFFPVQISPRSSSATVLSQTNKT